MKRPSTGSDFGRAACRWLGAALIILMPAVLTPVVSWAANKSAPASRPSPSRGGGFAARGPSGGFHMPSGTGGAHVPGSMAGVHMPGSMGGAHLPSGMAGAHLPSGFAGSAHLPTSMAGAAHLPGSMARSPVGVNRYAFHQPGAVRVATGRSIEPVHARSTDAFRPAAARSDAFVHDGMHAGTRMAAADPRIGGHAPFRTAGFDRAAFHAVPRGYLHPPIHPDFVRDRDFVGRHQHDFHTRFVRDFDHREMQRWRHGLWRNEWHYGRRGWWWDVDGVWYDYPDPVFPYPLEVATLVAYEQPTIDGPDLQAEELPPTVPPGAVADPRLAAAPSAGEIAPLPAPPPGRYACAEPAGFFPEIGECHGSWTLVAGTDATQVASQP